MGLAKYTSFKSCGSEDAREHSALITGAFSPDFFNTNTIQLWDVSSADKPEIIKWVGSTLADNSLHDIHIVNNGSVEKSIRIDGVYYLPDEPVDFGNILKLGAGEVAHFYGAATKKDGNIRLTLRTGSQTKRKKF
jgi:hypothetical protein